MYWIKRTGFILILIAQIHHELFLFENIHLFSDMNILFKMGSFIALLTKSSKTYNNNLKSLSVLFIVFSLMD